MGISNFNIDLLNDQSVPGSEIVTAMAEHESVYINYLVVLAQANSTSSFMVDTSSDVNELDQVIQNFTNEYLREEQMLEVVVAYEHTFSVDKKQGKLVSYQVSFDNKQKLFSAVFQKLSDFYLIISIMPTLVEDINEVISQETASDMTKELVKSCDAILRKEGIYNE